ncbi:Chromatin structure-remodeling complex subunit snf21 [Diplonema papillatum]|nr:Chromatin structure-remodeling complex subunit snf21 [Diplonema papillatum]
MPQANASAPVVKPLAGGTVGCPPLVPAGKTALTAFVQRPLTLRCEGLVRAVNHVRGVQAKAGRLLHACEAALKRHVQQEEAKRLTALRTGDETAYRLLLENTSNEKYKNLVFETERILRELGIDGISDVEARQTAPEDLKQSEAVQSIQLKRYQLEGVEFLYENSKRGVNSVLADEMGLGKTAQTIAWLCKLQEWLGSEPLRFLVVAPLSTLDNWMNEIRRVAPHFDVVKFHGGKVERAELVARLSVDLKKQGPGGVHGVVTQYATLASPALKDMYKPLLNARWSALVVDEGHKLNNATSLFSLRARCLQARHRVLLTGTPLQNDLHELWALLNFLMPTMFAKPTSFHEWFGCESPAQSRNKRKRTGLRDAPTEEEKLLMARRLHKVLRPFMLRREKAEVWSQLPAIDEHVVIAGLSEVQADLYNDALRHRILGNWADPANPTRISHGVYMTLRKLCLHPFLSLHPAAHRHVPAAQHVPLSGKLSVLVNVLDKLGASGHKALIFTQFSSVLDLLEETFAARWQWAKGEQYERLDGGTALDERSEAIVRFQTSGRCLAFMLTTRAGGQGINLQAADTVIFFDVDWNPQQDLQAVARAHRLGQQRHVKVFRLLTTAPVEQNMSAVAGEKLQSEELAIKAGLYNLTANDDDRDRRIRQALTRGDASYLPPAAATTGTPQPDPIQSQGADIDGPAVPPVLLAEQTGGTSPEELNAMLARSEDESRLFNSMPAPAALATWADLPPNAAIAQKTAVEERTKPALDPVAYLASLGPRQAGVRACERMRALRESSSGSGSGDGGAGSAASGRAKRAKKTAEPPPAAAHVFETPKVCPRRSRNPLPGCVPAGDPTGLQQSESSATAGPACASEAKPAAASPQPAVPDTRICTRSRASSGISSTRRAGYPHMHP